MTAAHDWPGGGSDGRVRISEEEARLLQEVIREHCGMQHGMDSTFFLERRLQPRLDALGIQSYTDYFYYLRYDPNGPKEMEQVVERITTHETYFFREQYQLDAFSYELLPELHERLGKRRRRLAVWSAGCSTGEEVYTLAMLIREHGGFDDWNVRVVGSDISKEVITHARQGYYREGAFRTTPDLMRARYFEPGDVPGRSRINDKVRSLCSFGQLNLLTTERFQVLGPIDVIFCRNVLIYLSQEARAQVVDAFYDSLAPGGYLLLGHSESLLNVSTRFELVHLERDLVYRRPLEETL